MNMKWIWTILSYIAVLNCSCEAVSQETAEDKTPKNLKRLMPSEAFCRAYLVNYKTPEGVNYQPGVDTSGRPVVPADLNSYSIELPKRITLPVIFPRHLLERGAGTTAGNSSPQATESDKIRYPYIDDIPLGNMEFDLKTKELWYQGKPLGNKAEMQLRKDCRKVLAHANGTVQENNTIKEKIRQQDSNHDINLDTIVK